MSVYFEKPYVSPVDLKVKFKPKICISSDILNDNDAIELCNDIMKTVAEVRYLIDYFEKYKDDETELRKLVDGENNVS